MAGVEDLTGTDLRAHQLGKLLLSNPEITREAQRLAIKANPALRIPEIELEDRIVKVEADAKERERKLEEQLMAERVTRRQNERNAQIKEAGFEVADIEKIIVDEKCTYETALKIAALQRTTAEPSAHSVRSGTAIGEGLGLVPQEDWKKLDAAGARRMSNSIAHQMIDEFRGRKRA